MRKVTRNTVWLIIFLATISLTCSKGKGTTGSDQNDEINGITFVSIPGGTFQMGDEVGDLSDGCRPVHKVTVSSFEMGVYEVTNAQYAAYLNEALKTVDVTAMSESVKGATGVYKGQEYLYLAGYYSPYPGNDCKIQYSNGTFSVKSGYENWPVAWVTWYGAKSFALYYRLDLPTEAEWEYSCRGGKKYKYGTISTSTVNYWDTGIKHPVDVGSYLSNPFGLYDMSGNVWEWCHDWYGSYSSGSMTNPSGAQTGATRVIRGGSWYNYDDDCRSANRATYSSDGGDDGVGFRVVRRSQ